MTGNTNGRAADGREGAHEGGAGRGPRLLDRRPHGRERHRPAAGGRRDTGAGRRTRADAHSARGRGRPERAGRGDGGRSGGHGSGHGVRGAPAHAATRERRTRRAAPGAAGPARPGRRGLPRRLPRAPLVRGRGPARRAGRDGGAAPADRQGGALCRVRREDRHRGGVPGGPADRDGRGHRLRPGLDLQAVHLAPGGPADRARRPGAGGRGRLVPPGLHAAAASRTSRSVIC